MSKYNRYGKHGKYGQHNNTVHELDGQLLSARSFVWPPSVGLGWAIVCPMATPCTVWHTTDVLVATVSVVGAVTSVEPPAYL